MRDRLVRGLDLAIDRAGGADAVAACGRVAIVVGATCHASPWPGSSTSRWPTIVRSLPRRGRRDLRRPRHADAGARPASSGRFGVDRSTRGRPDRPTGRSSPSAADPRPVGHDLGAAYRIVSADAPALGGRPGDRTARPPWTGAWPPSVPPTDHDEVIVVDGPVGAHRRRGPQHRCARGRRHDVLVFVDADVEVHPDAFDRIRAAFADAGDRPRSSARTTTRRRCTTTVSAFRNLLHHHVHQTNAGRTDDVLDRPRRGAASRVRRRRRVRRRALPHPSVEDIDLGRRLVERGAAILLDPTIQGKHLKAWTLRSMVWTDFARRGVPGSR